MYAKRLKSDLVELCRQRGLCIGRSTKEQLIAQLEERDRLDDPIPVPEGSRPADAAWVLGPDRAGRGQTAAEDIPRPFLPMSGGGVGGSTAKTKGTLTPAASRGSSRRSSPSLEWRQLEWEREMKMRELEDHEKQCQHEEKQRQHEQEEKEKQRQHELELARLRSSGALAAREVPQESTGFSPFELSYGRRVRGPLDLMRDEWEGKATPDGESVVEYVLIFRERLAELMGLARENLARAQRKQKVWYDRTARARAYATGDPVMVLIPVRKNKLQATWEGPFKVIKQLNVVNYVVELSNRAHHCRVYHVNMMKPYYARGNVVLAMCGQWEEQGDDPLVDLFPGTRAGSPLETIPLSDQLTPAQQAEVRGVLHPSRQLFSNQPGRTNLTVHRVQTGSHPPIRCSPFRVTGKTAQDLEREVRDMLALRVIQPSASPWASPVVLVPKKDGSVRFCVDYRKLNAITVSDAYPMPRPDELLDKLGGARYLTTMDLTKGYWQVPLDADARLKSAFITPLGLYEFLTLPFGLKGAPATFQRLVDQLLRGMESFAVAYIDDICVFSQTWEDHVSRLDKCWTDSRGLG
ncbi:unnamed protein product [Eretmochelys imbricata]